MRTLRFSLAALSLLLVAGWLWLRKPYSPTDDIPPVAYTAFEVNPPTDQAGEALALAARTWQGVTACTYNPASRLLVLSHQEQLTENDLQRRLQILSSQPVMRKTFAEPDGPKCPVPQGAIAALPGWLLGGGLISAIGFALLVFSGNIRKNTPVLS